MPPYAAVELIFFQGECADKWLDMLAEHGAAALVDSLLNATTFDNPTPTDEPFGAPSDAYEQAGDYVVTYNRRYNYLGLNRLTT